MHNKVVFRTMKALNGFGFPVLRFNFRGVASSAGTHDEGRGEIADVRVALDYLSERFGLPILFAGFSFGAAIGLRAAAVHPQVKGLILVGTPVNAEGRGYRYELLRQSTLPKLMVSGDRDPFASVAQLEEIFDAAAEPKRLVVIPGADHFFGGHLDELREAIHRWVSEVVLGNGSTLDCPTGGPELRIPTRGLSRRPASPHLPTEGKYGPPVGLIVLPVAGAAWRL